MGFLVRTGTGLVVLGEEPGGKDSSRWLEAGRTLSVSGEPGVSMSHGLYNPLKGLTWA